MVDSKFWTLLRNDDRYSPTEVQKKKHPQMILVKGTLEQAQYVASKLGEVGCDYYYYILEDDEE